MSALLGNPTGRLREYRPVIALASPIAGIQLAQVALTTVDLAMMGLLGVTAIAAGGMAILLYNQLRTMSVGMVTGIGNQIAGAVGRGEKRTGSDELDDEARTEIRELVRAGLFVATLVSMLAAVILIGLGFALPLFGQRREVVDMARPMMIALAPGLVPMLSTQPDACTFADRCPAASDLCRTSQPPLEETRTHHEVACWHPNVEVPT